MFIATQLNSTRQREQQLTRFVGRDVINKNTTDLSVRCSTGSVEFSSVELSCVAINTPLVVLLIYFFLLCYNYIVSVAVIVFRPFTCMYCSFCCWIFWMRTIYIIAGRWVVSCAHRIIDRWCIYYSLMCIMFSTVFKLINGRIWSIVFWCFLFSIYRYWCSNSVRLSFWPISRCSAIVTVEGE